MAEDFDCGVCHATTISCPTLTLCGHRFCDSCIRHHVSRIPKCPVCDQVVLIDDLRPESSLATSRHHHHHHHHRDSVPSAPDGPITSSSGEPAASTLTAMAHAPDVTFGLPPDGPPPYSSTPQGSRDLMGMDSGIDIRSGRALQPGAVEYSTLLRNANNSSETDMRKRYRSLKKSVTLFSFVAIVLFVIILCLLVIILAMKRNPVCDLSTPHSEALTVNILGEIRYAREQAKVDHRDLQNRLTEIFSRHSNSITGGLSRQIDEAKENITADFAKLDRKFNEIFGQVTLLQSRASALESAASASAFFARNGNYAVVKFFLPVVVYLANDSRS